LFSSSFLEGIEFSGLFLGCLDQNVKALGTVAGTSSNKRLPAIALNRERDRGGVEVNPVER
jgi:hypothetical protein